MSAELAVTKGHGTENDFVIIDDIDGEVALSVDLVRALCDRRAGVGGDGVLRVVRTAFVADAPASAAATAYFMDYRNADGSIAEMCGNGLRVFVRYLAETGRLDTDRPVIGTRAGALATRIEADGQITVGLGHPQLLAARPGVQAEPMVALRAGSAVLMPNPHVVVGIDTAADLAALDLTRPPAVEDALPDGQNIEFVFAAGEHHLVMRVYERGVGETRSCGTGIGAIVAVHGRPEDTRPWRVDVPGGTCSVRWDEQGVWLTGPAVLVGRVELSAEWLSAAVPSMTTPVAIRR